eukprot:1336344-Amphidinium_carterae.1
MARHLWHRDKCVGVRAVPIRAAEDQQQQQQQKNLFVACVVPLGQPTRRSKPPEVATSNLVSAIPCE